MSATKRTLRTQNSPIISMHNLFMRSIKDYDFLSYFLLAVMDLLDKTNSYSVIQKGRNM